MFTLVLSMFLVAQTQSDTPSKPVAKPSIEAEWQIIGNGFPGTLKITVQPNHTLTGSIYDQPIRGKWWPETNQFEFIRFRDEAGEYAIQLWEGELRVESKDKEARPTLSGVYRSLAGPDFGATGRNYEWTGSIPGPDGLWVGMPARTSIVAQFVNGEIAGRNRCPVLYHHDATKIAVFAREFNPSVLSIIQAADKMVAADESLQHSFAMISHENAPTPTEEAYEAQLQQIERIAKEKQIDHLPIGVMIRIPELRTGGRARSQLGFFGKGDVVVMLISPDEGKNQGIVRYFRVLETESIDGATVERITHELSAATAKLRN